MGGGGERGRTGGGAITKGYQYQVQSKYLDLGKVYRNFANVTKQPTGGHMRVLGEIT